MTVKFKYHEKSENFSIKGLDANHLIVIFKLLNHVRLGDGPLSDAALDIIRAYDNSEYGGDLEYLISDSTIDISYDMEDGTEVSRVFDADGVIVDPTIEISFADN